MRPADVVPPSVLTFFIFKACRGGRNNTHGRGNQGLLTQRAERMVKQLQEIHADCVRALRRHMMEANKTCGLLEEIRSFRSIPR